MSRAIRVRLKKQKIETGITVVYSNEQTERELLPLQNHQSEDPDNFRILDKMRIRIVPVLGTMPSIFGISLASFVQKEL